MAEKTKTEEIFELSAPYNNSYQGPDPRILFVCSAGLLRSATAANLFAKKGWNTRNCGTAEYALIPLSFNLLCWADKVFFMSESNFDEAMATFEKHVDALEMINKKSVTLCIPDRFSYNQKDLIDLLEEKVQYVRTES